MSQIYSCVLRAAILTANFVFIFRESPALNKLITDEFMEIFIFFLKYVYFMSPVT